MTPISPSPLKVAVVTSFPRDAARPHGGVEAVSVNLVRALARRDDVETHVVTTDEECRQAEQHNWQGARIHRLPRPPGSALVFARRDGRRLVQDYLRQLQPAVVHAHDTYGIMVQGLPLPRVFTIHGFIHEDTRYAGGLLAWARACVWRRIEMSAWADQPHIVSITPYVRERLRGLTHGVIHDIDNPVDEAFFEVRRERPGGGVFSAAAICRRKNTLTLVAAVERLRREGVEVTLRLAGSATERAYEAQVREFVARHGLERQVEFLGPLSAEAVRAELERAGVFALVSLEEGAPLGVSEAMAAGVPVVASNRCGLPYMVLEGETGFLVDPRVPDEIAARLRALLETPTRNAAFGARAREIALDRFHPARVAERTVRVYRACLGDFGN